MRLPAWDSLYLIEIGLVIPDNQGRFDGLSARTANILAECKPLASKDQCRAALRIGELRWDGSGVIYRGRMIRGLGAKSFTEICSWAGVDSKPLLAQDRAIKNSIRVLRKQLRAKQARDGSGSVDHLKDGIQLLRDDLDAFIKGVRLP